jgi:hypothetical protein
MTTNEAAERLRIELIDEYILWLDEALAAERRATVERIRSAVDWNVPAHEELEHQLATALDEIGYGNADKDPVGDYADLDEEAAR